jgi:hypothetical protein
VLVGLGDAGVDEGAGGELGAVLLGGELEGEVGEEGGVGVVGEEDLECFLGGAVDGADDEVACGGGVLARGQ